MKITSKDVAGILLVIGMLVVAALTGWALSGNWHLSTAADKDFF